MLSSYVCPFVRRKPVLYLTGKNLVFWRKDLGKIPHATGRQMQVGLVNLKSTIFDQYLVISQKRYKIET